MNLMIHICLDNFHDTASSPSVKIYSLVNFESLVSDIQLSLYTLNIIG
jgi:hypothetical protein